MNTSIIHLICNIVMFVCLLFVSFCNKKLRNYINELKKTIKDEKFIKQNLINQQQKKIETLRIRYNKPFDYVTGKPKLFSFENAKQDMAVQIANEMIKNNIIQIKEFDYYYEGKIDFVKSESTF